MYIVSSYAIAVLFTVVTMLCWGSWANTQKLAAKTWRFELFYWDYVVGLLLLSLISAFSIGSFGEGGRSFLADIQQAELSSVGSAFLGGVVFNAANILLVAAISIAGMAVAFPVGIGIALIMGVLVNYIGAPQGDAVLLFSGVGLIAAAIVMDAQAYRSMSGSGLNVSTKGIVISAFAGVLMALFYRFVAASMSVDFVNPAVGKMTSYSAVVVFALGIFISNFVFNTIFMRKPIEGEPVSYRQYFAGGLKTHLTGVLGGAIWCVGMSLSMIAAGKAGYAISYGLGQGATLVAALWGVFVWKEFRGASKSTNVLLAFMFLCFVAGIAMIIMAGR
ncbi:multidrug DMT transporter permease [Tichowtungia aerotolerans]|uniref:Multidrug DMT transporter permease n=1 Tax=Tichowtungia aerotolerans TaxID=2697043 RepID=A0A6P1M156_9BACT|nr:multidrug DMT transporter permease [Tichowtungia aerotolerans]QHI68539.1 multidrug DMT transporter permease [Tichowtungia aerotolerans]